MSALGPFNESNTPGWRVGDDTGPPPGGYFGSMIFALFVGACGILELLGAFTSPLLIGKVRDWSDDAYLTRTAILGVFAAVGIGLAMRASRVDERNSSVVAIALGINIFVAMMMIIRLARYAGVP